MQQLFAALTTGLSGLPGNPLRGLTQFLHTYLGTPEQPVPFGGRQKQLDELSDWLTLPNEPYALIVEEAGRGKSALVTHWVAHVVATQCADVALIPISISAGTSLKHTALSLLGARLRYLMNVQTEAPRDMAGWLTEIGMFLHEDHDLEHPLLIVLDGVDEATDWSMGRDLRFPSMPGKGIKVLVSARSLAHCDAQGWLHQLGWQNVGRRIELPLLEQKHIIEVIYSLRSLTLEANQQAEIIYELYRLSEGDPLLLRLYLDALSTKARAGEAISVEDLRQLKPALQAYFDQWWNDQEQAWGEMTPLVKHLLYTLLNLFACALGPLYLDDLLALLAPEAPDSAAVTQGLSSLGRFVIGDGRSQGYIFSHPRLANYFYAKIPDADRTMWEERFISYGQRSLSTLISGEVSPAAISPYVVRNYGAHLERAGADSDQFDVLICQQWLQSWLELDATYDGFVRDLSRAWHSADISVFTSLTSQDRSTIIGRQCRYALILTSINTLINNIPPNLLKALFSRKIWTAVQVFAYAWRVPDIHERVALLVFLAPHLPDSVLPAALEVAWAFDDEDKQVTVLHALIPHLSLALLLKALDFVRAMTDKGWQVALMAAIMPRLPKPLDTALIREAFTITQSILKESSRANACARLMPYVPPIMFPEILHLIRAFLLDEDRIIVLNALAARKPMQLLEEMLAIANAIENERERGLVYLKLAPLLPETMLPVLIEVLSSIANYRDRVCMLAELSVFFPTDQRADIIDSTLAMARASTDASTRAQALKSLIPYVSEPMKAIIVVEALKTACSTYSERPLELAHFILECGSSVPVEFLRKALHIIHTLPDQQRSSMIWHVASHLPTELESEALALVRTISDEEERRSALSGLLRYLSPAAIPLALEIVLEIADEQERVWLLKDILPRLPEPLLYITLASVRSMFDEQKRAEALADVCEYLPAPLQQTVLHEIFAIEEEVYWAEDVAFLLPHLPLSLQQEVLEAVRKFDDDYCRFEALIRLLPRVPEALLSETLAIIPLLKDEHEQIEALLSLPEHLPASWQQMAMGHALNATRVIEDKYKRETAITELSYYFPDALMHEDVTNVLATVGKSTRAHIFVRIASELSGVQLEDALQITLTYFSMEMELDDETDISSDGDIEWALSPLSCLPYTLIETTVQFIMAVVHRSQRDHIRMNILINLAPYLSSVLLQEALDIALAIEENFDRMRVLLALAPYVPASSMLQILDAARAAKSHYSYSLALDLIELLPHVPDSLKAYVIDEVWAIISTLDSEHRQAELVEKLAPHLSLTRLSDALSIVRSITRVDARMQGLLGLLPYLPDTLQAEVVPEILESAPDIADAFRRAQFLLALTPYLPAEQQPGFLREMLAVPSVHGESRDMDIIVALVSRLPASLLPPVIEALHDCWDYKLADILGQILLLLPTSLIPQVWGIVRAMTYDQYQKQAVLVILPFLPDSLLREVLVVARKMDSEYYRPEILYHASLRVRDLPVQEQYMLWCENLHILAQRQRPALLLDLAAFAPVIESLGGKQALADVAEFIIEVGEWLP